MNELTTTGITQNYEPVPTKKQIIQRLFEAGHISFNEMWVLLLDDPEVRYVPMPQETPPIILPWTPQPPWDKFPYEIGDFTDNKDLTIDGNYNIRFHNEGRGEAPSESPKANKVSGNKRKK